MVGYRAHAYRLGVRIRSVQLPVRFSFSLAPLSLYKDDANSGQDMAWCKWVVPYHHTPKHHAAHVC